GKEFYILFSLIAAFKCRNKLDHRILYRTQRINYIPDVLSGNIMPGKLTSQPTSFVYLNFIEKKKMIFASWSHRNGHVTGTFINIIQLKESSFILFCHYIFL